MEKPLFCFSRDNGIPVNKVYEKQQYSRYQLCCCFDIFYTIRVKTQGEVSKICNISKEAGGFVYAIFSHGMCRKHICTPWARERIVAKTTISY